MRSEFTPFHIHYRLYAVEIAMTGALAPKQSSRCTDIKLFDRALDAIAVALPAI